MPFTLCHPAAVIPLHRCARNFTSFPAMVIGSMAPDFVYFISIGVGGTFTHTLSGVPIFCVPAGLVVYVVYYLLIRAPIVAWLPAAISTRMTRNVPWQLRNVRSIAIVLLSLAIGASTHVLWDSFTHANTIITRSVVMFQSVIPVGPYDVPLVKILQQLSSLLGFVVISTYLVRWFRRTEPLAPQGTTLNARQQFFALAVVLVGGVSGAAAGVLYRSALSVERALFNIVVSGMVGTGLAILVLCISWNVASRREK